MPALCPDDSRTVCQIKLFFTSTLLRVFHFSNRKQVAEKTNKQTNTFGILLSNKGKLFNKSNDRKETQNQLTA